MLSFSCKWECVYVCLVLGVCVWMFYHISSWIFAFEAVAVADDDDDDDDKQQQQKTPWHEKRDEN